MKTVSKSMLKPKMLEYFREAEETGEPLIVTSHNRPVLKIEPIKKNRFYRMSLHRIGEGPYS